MKLAAILWAALFVATAISGLGCAGAQPPPAVQSEKGANMVADNAKITTFLMFEGQAEEAMNFYVSLLDDSRIVQVTRYGKEGPGKEGSVLRATFTLAGRQFMCIDSPIHHGFTFTPAISLYVDCRSEDEISRLATRLAKGGTVMMPLDSYPFSKRFAWIADRFGVSWQLNLGGKT